jgi:hypothetical protein
MKRVFLLTILLKLLKTTDSDSETKVECDSQILSNYGFVGTDLELDYKEMISENKISTDYCPLIKKSCCSAWDYQKSNELWQKKVDNIRKYVTTIHEQIMQIYLLSKSFGSFKSEVTKSKHPICKEIDFNSMAVNYSNLNIYHLLKGAFEAFAFLQKGFYCTICNFETFRFFKVNEVNMTQPSIQISRESCSDFIYFLKDLINFKSNFIDNLFKNVKMIKVCLGKENEQEIDLSIYDNTGLVDDCLKNQKRCEFLCKKISFGSSGELILGKLGSYIDFFKDAKDLFQTDSFDENIRKLENIDSNFFSENPKSSKNISNWRVKISKSGLNLFKNAKFSNYSIKVNNSNLSLEQEIVQSLKGRTKFPQLKIDSEKEKIDIGDQKKTDLGQENIENQELANEGVPTPNQDEIDKMNKELKEMETQNHLEFVSGSVQNADQNQEHNENIEKEKDFNELNKNNIPKDSKETVLNFYYIFTSTIFFIFL